MVKKKFRYNEKGKPHMIIISEDKEGEIRWWKEKPLTNEKSKGLHIINVSGLPAHLDIYEDQRGIGKEYMDVVTGSANFQSGANTFTMVSGADAYLIPITPVENFDYSYSGGEMKIIVGTSGTMVYASTSGALTLKQLEKVE